MLFGQATRGIPPFPALARAASRRARHAGNIGGSEDPSGR